MKPKRDKKEGQGSKGAKKTQARRDSYFRDLDRESPRSVYDEILEKAELPIIERVPSLIEERNATDSGRTGDTARSNQAVKTKARILGFEADVSRRMLRRVYKTLEKDPAHAPLFELLKLRPNDPIPEEYWRAFIDAHNLLVKRERTPGPEGHSAPVIALDGRLHRGKSGAKQIEQQQDSEMPRRNVITPAKPEPARPKPPSHRPGYPRRDRQGKFGLMIQLTKDQRKQLHDAAEAGGFDSTQKFVTLVLAEVAKQFVTEKENTTIPKAVGKHRAAVMQAALRLVAALK